MRLFGAFAVMEEMPCFSTACRSASIFPGVTALWSSYFSQYRAHPAILLLGYNYFHKESPILSTPASQIMLIMSIHLNEKQPPYIYPLKHPSECAWNQTYSTQLLLWCHNREPENRIYIWTLMNISQCWPAQNIISCRTIDIDMI